MNTENIIIPRHDLCADLRVDPEPDLEGLDAEFVGSASNRHIRIYHAMFMLDTDSMQEAIDLYEHTGHGALVDREGRLETPELVTEILQLVAIYNLKCPRA